VDSNAQQALAMNSWGIQLFTPALWKRAVAELCVARPKYVFVFDRFLWHLRTGDHGATMSVLSRDYAPAEQTKDGQWFVRNSVRQSSFCARTSLAATFAGSAARRNQSLVA
jgi:hypothetical protein